MASKMSASSVSGGNANNNFATSAKDNNSTTGVAGIASVSANADVHPRKRKIRSKVNNTVNNSEERERERVRERERSTDRDHHSHHHFHHHHNAKSGGGASSVGSGAPSATTHTLTNTGGAHLASNNTVGINSSNTSIEARGASAGNEERSAVGASANASGGVAYATAGKSDGNAAAHDYPFTNCFQMCLNLRKQLEKKWRSLYLIKPRPPQGYAEYLLNKRTYLLNPKDGLAATTDDNDMIVVPASVAPKMSEIYTQQEQERQCLFKRHTVERQKLCLNVEQEIIRVHSKAAHNISCQSLPYSVCTLLKDEEVYNFIDQTNEEKERSNRHRFNGRQLLSWLQDVDDKWEKIKDSMILRHHNEAESLHAVQLMDWEIALKKYELCDFRSSSFVDEEHVPIINVNETFDLLPS